MVSALVVNNMQFAAFYQFDGGIRSQVYALLTQAIKQGINLAQQPIQHPLVRTVPTWPDMKTLINLPLATQCEYFEYLEDNLRSVRVLICDAEVVITREEIQKVETSPPAPPENPPLTNPQT